MRTRFPTSANFFGSARKVVADPAQNLRMSFSRLIAPPCLEAD